MVTLAIIGTLTALLLPALSYCKEESRSVQCLSNLKQWGVALDLYAADHDGYTPRRGQGVQPFTVTNRPEDWFNALPPYLGLSAYSDQLAAGNLQTSGNNSAFDCPSAVNDKKNPNFVSYAMNMYLSPWIRPNPHRLSELPNLSQLAFLADGPGGWCSAIPSIMNFSVVARHNGRVNVVFCDGHAQSLPGSYVGCGTGETVQSDIRWQTLSDGINQAPLP